MLSVEDGVKVYIESILLGSLSQETDQYLPVSSLDSLIDFDIVLLEDPYDEVQQLLLFVNTLSLQDMLDDQEEVSVLVLLCLIHVHFSETEFLQDNPDGHRGVRSGRSGTWMSVIGLKPVDDDLPPDLALFSFKEFTEV